MWTTSVVILTLENLLYYFCFVVYQSTFFFKSTHFFSLKLLLKGKNLENNRTQMENQ